MLVKWFVWKTCWCFVRLRGIDLQIRHHTWSTWHMISISAWHQSNQLSSTKYIKLNVRKFWVLAEHGRVLHRPSNFQISLVHYKDTLFLRCFCNFFFVVMQSSIYCAISINLAGLVTHYTPAKILISAPCKNRVFHGYTSGRTFHNRTRNCGNRNRHGFG